MIRNTILLAIIAFFTACSTQAPKDLSKVTIAGKILNLTEETEIYLVEGREKNKIEIADSLYVKKIDANGSGNLYSINIAPETEVITLFLMPGDSVFITFDAKTKELVFSGDKILANNYYKAKAEKNKEAFFNIWAKFELNLEDFATMIDSLEKSRIGFLENYVKEKPETSKDFVYFEESSINYEIYLYKSYYSQSYSYTTKDTLDPKSAYFDFEKLVNLNDVKLLNSTEYKQFGAYYIGNLAEQLTKKETKYKATVNPVAASRLEIIKKEVTDSKLLDYHLHALLKTQLNYYGTKGIDAVYPYFTENCLNSDYKSEIDSIKTIWEALAKGKDSYNFTAFDVKGKTYKQEDFKGNYIFIDCWATWCGPCKAEIPALEKLVEEYKEKNIVFVSLSFDQDKKAWENWMNTKETKGIQLYLEKDEKTKLSDFYKVTGIPRFILIDQEGKIYDAQADRPSGNIKNTIDKLENLQ